MDTAYAISYDQHDQAAYMFYGAEISAKLQSVFSFAAGLFGSSRFPKYEARTGFSQSGAAQSSVSSSAVDLAKSAADTARGALSAVGGGMVVMLLAAGVVAYIMMRKK